VQMKRCHCLPNAGESGTGWSRALLLRCPVKKRPNINAGFSPLPKALVSARQASAGTLLL
jgi:hypothetical protein